jgi:signal transduction histidine kinase
VRTTVAASSVVGLGLVVAAAGLVGVLRESLHDNVETSARLRARDVVSIVRSGSVPDELSVERDDDGDEEETFIQVIDPSGRVVAASRNVAGSGPLADVPPGGRQRTHGMPISPEDPYLVVAEEAETEDGDRVIVLVGRALEPADETVGSVVRVLLVGVPVLVALVALTTWAVVGRALRPVGAITSEVQSITAAGLDRRVPEPSAQDEIGRLARTMNAMLERLEAARDRQRRFVSDASHELRSPIASMRHQLEVALAHPGEVDVSRLVRDLLADDLRVQQVVDDLLLLARSDEDAERPHVAVDLDDVVLAAVRAARGLEEVRVDATGVGAARVQGDPTHLAVVVRNLVDNAVRHARSLVAVQLSTSGQTVLLRVDDDGPGVPPDDRERVFERFTRLDDARTRSRGGAGLGLAIVRQLVARHHGTVRCTEAPIGGARFEVRLPDGDV